MTTPIPRDPVQLMAARIAIGITLLLAVLALLPRPVQTAPVQAQAPRVIVVTATPHEAPEPPAPQPAPVVQETAPTAAPAAVMPAAPVVQESEPAPIDVTNPPIPEQAHVGERPSDKSAPMPRQAPPVVVHQTTSADPSLQIARDAAAAYQQLPVAQPPSAENDQPVTVRRPHTGR